MRRRFLAIVRKEFIHIVRDWRSLFIIFLMPVLMIIIYGYAITLDMKNIHFAVIDEANTPASHELIRHFRHNGFFIEHTEHITREEIDSYFKARRLKLVIVVPRHFDEQLATDALTPVQLLIDASDSNVGTFVNNYALRVFRAFNEERNRHTAATFMLEPRLLYNPDLKSSYFFVPALVAIILLLISSLLTSITITREKETGTLEQILVSPVHPFEIVVGKVIPYIVIGLINGTLILVSAHLIFSVPILGSLGWIALFSLVYIFTALSFGLMISTVARTQQVAMFLTLMTTILPTMLLSGFLFPIPSMPLPLQWISRVIPATYFLVIIRGLMLKGIGFLELWREVAMLGGIGVLLIAASVKRFKTNLEA